MSASINLITSKYCHARALDTFLVSGIMRARFNLTSCNSIISGPLSHTLSCFMLLRKEH